MKYLRAGVCILGVCLVLCLSVTARLETCTERTASLLEQAEKFGAAGRFDQATLWVERAMEDWESSRGFFGVALRHDEVVEITGAFRALRAYARSANAEEFEPCCAGLLARIRYVSEKEKPYYYNLM